MKKITNGILLTKLTRITMRIAIFVVLNLLRLRHLTFRHETRSLSIEAKLRHVKEITVTELIMRKRLLHQIILVDDSSMLKLIANILGRRPADNAMILKNDVKNRRNDDEFDRVGNKRRSLIRFPIIPKIHIGKPA